MRHSYDDHSYIDGKNDAPLTSKGIEIARNEAAIIVPKIAEKYPVGLDLRSSSKKRAVETTEIIAQELSRYRVEYEVTIEDGLRELYQGEMLGLAQMTHEDKVSMLEIGWQIFEKERLLGNDNYRFGTPDYTNRTYENFNKFIRYPYGESQNDLSSRVEKAFIETLLSSVDKKKVPLIIAHRGTIKEVLNLAVAHNKGVYDIDQNPEIEMSGWRYCELFTTSIDDVEFSKGALRRFVKS